MPKNSSEKAFTLVEILIVVGIIALIASVSIPNLIAVKRSANEAAAKGNLRSLSSAAETASISLGHYPVSIGELQTSINSAASFCADVTGSPTSLNGYNYSCTMDVSGYTFVVSPTNPGVSGNITYTATTGGILTPL